MSGKAYISWVEMSDGNLVKTIGEFVRHHRLRQNQTQELVARNAGISRSTLSLLERGETVTLTTVMQVLRALDLLRVMDAFQVQHEQSPLELARLEQSERKRARRNNELQEPEMDW
jgi:transcriptional regulator with XRE-family HTH domain